MPTRRSDEIRSQPVENQVQSVAHRLGRRGGREGELGAAILSPVRTTVKNQNHPVLEIDKFGDSELRLGRIPNLHNSPMALAIPHHHA